MFILLRQPPSHEPPSDESTVTNCRHCRQSHLCALNCTTFRKCNVTLNIVVSSLGMTTNEILILLGVSLLPHIIHICGLYFRMSYDCNKQTSSFRRLCLLFTITTKSPDRNIPKIWQFWILVWFILRQWQQDNGYIDCRSQISVYTDERTRFTALGLRWRSPIQVLTVVDVA